MLCISEILNDTYENLISRGGALGGQFVASALKNAVIRQKYGSIHAPAVRPAGLACLLLVANKVNVEAKITFHFFIQINS